MTAPFDIPPPSLSAPDLPPLPESSATRGQTLQYTRADTLDYGRACFNHALEHAALIVEREAFPAELARFGVAADAIRGLKRKP